MRPASSKAGGLGNEHVPCSAGGTPAIQQFPPGRAESEFSAPSSWFSGFELLELVQWNADWADRADLLDFLKERVWGILLPDLVCLLDSMRPASSKAGGLGNEHVPCSAGGTPAIQQFPPGRAESEFSAPSSWFSGFELQELAQWNADRADRADLLD